MAPTPRDLPPVGAGEELRTATILFALIDGLPMLLEERDPEDVKDLLDDVFGLLTRQITAHGGVVDKIMADSVMALFGVPTAHEDDASRAVAAALGMVRSVEALNRQLFRERGLRLSLKVGLSTGRVVTGFVGGGEGGAFTVLGDAVNVASRLEHAAPPGGILISEITRRLLHDRFRLRTWPALQVKGRAEPLPAHQVLGEADGPSPPSLDGDAPVPLVGRSEELDRLIGLWREVEQDRVVRWVTVYGDVGMGKRRLLDEFMRVAERSDPRPRVISLRGVPSFGGEASDLLRLFVHALAGVRADDDAQAEWEKLHALARQSIDGRDGSAEAVARSLAGTARLSFPAGGPDLPRVGGRFDALVHLVADVAADGPLLIALSALHDADDLTLDFLQDLAADLPEGPVMILGLARPEFRSQRRAGWGAASKRHRELEMGPLSLAQTRTLMARLMAGTSEVSAEWAARMQAFTGGNPFYITETVRGIVEQGGDGEGELPTPESIEAVIQSRIDRLGFEEGLTLRAAAVVGDVFWQDALAAILGGDRSASLQALIQARFVHRLARPGLQGQEAFAFTHQLLAQVAYDNLLSDVRSRYHRACASWLAARLGADAGAYRALLARHLERGGEDLAAARAWLDAARAAAADYRFGEAVALLEQAGGCRDRCDSPDARLSASLDQARGEALRGLGRLDEAREALASAAGGWEALGDRSSAGIAWVRLGWVQLLAGAYDAVEDALAQARPEGSPPLPEVEGQALHLDAELHLFRGDTAPVAALLERAEAAMVRAGDDPGLAAVKNAWGKYHDRLSQLPSARKAFKAAVDMRQSLGDIPGLASSLNNLGSVLEGLGDLSGAEVCHARSLTVRRRLEDRFGVGATLLNQASVLQRRGYLGRAVRRLERGRELFQAHHSAWGVTLANGELGRLMLMAGALDEARGLLNEAARVAQGMGAAVVEAEQRARLGQCLGQQGDRAGARAELERSVALAIQGGNPEVEATAMMGLAEVALQLGDAVGAAELLEELEWNEALLHNAWLKARLALVAAEVSLGRGAAPQALTRFEEARSRALRHDLWPLVWQASAGRLRALGPEADGPGELSVSPRVAAPRAEAVASAKEALAELFARVEDPDLVAALRTTRAVVGLFGELKG